MSQAKNIIAADSSTSRRQEVEDKLRRAIVRGDFAPGEHLSDRTLCQHFAVSRTVVREAVRRLEAEGLVESFPNRGSFVRVLREDEVVQIFDVRGVLEAWASYRFVQLATVEQIEEMVSSLEEMKLSVVRGEWVEVVEKKQNFNTVLFSVYNNKFIETTLNQIQNWSGQLRAAAMSVPDRVAPTIKEIDRLIDAIRRRDEAEVWQASLERVHNAGTAALSVIHERTGGKAHHVDDRGVPQLAISPVSFGAEPEELALRKLHDQFAALSADERSLQDLLLEYCRTRDGIDRRTRVLLNLAMLCVANRPHEIEAHVRSALAQGIAKNDIAETLLQAAVYCGVPMATQSLRVARKVFEEVSTSAGDGKR